MTIEGDFNTLFLADILQLLCNHGKTGVLKASHGDDEVKTYIKEGEIICVMGSKESTRLGNILVHNRIITPEQLMVHNRIITPEQLKTCLDIAQKKKKALGKVLIEQKLVTENTLNKFIDRQAEDIILDMLLWEAGSFVYNDYDLDINDLIIPRLNIMKILMQATRRIDEMSVLSKLIPSDQMRFKPLAKTEETEALQLDDIERRVLRLVAEEKTVREIINTVKSDEFLCYKAFYALISSGLIKHSKERSKRFESEEKLFFPAIKIYVDILNTIHEQVKPALGRQTSDVFETCKPAKSPLQEALLENFHLNNPLATSVQNITEILQSEVKSEEQRTCLIGTFNSYIYNLLEKLPGFIGEPAAQKLLKKIDVQLAKL